MYICFKKKAIFLLFFAFGGGLYPDFEAITEARTAAFDRILIEPIVDFLFIPAVDNHTGFPKDCQMAADCWLRELDSVRYVVDCHLFIGQ